MATDRSLSTKATETRHGSAGWQIQMLAAVLNREMQARLAKHGLRQEQFMLLMSLTEQDGVTQTELGQRVNLAGYTVTRALDALEEQGLVERQADAGSRRAHRVRLTEAGRALMPRLFALVGEVNADFLDPLEPEARPGFLAALTRLVSAHLGSRR